MPASPRAWRYTRDTDLHVSASRQIPLLRVCGDVRVWFSGNSAKPGSAPKNKSFRNRVPSRPHTLASRRGALSPTRGRGVLSSLARKSHMSGLTSLVHDEHMDRHTKRPVLKM